MQIFTFLFVVPYQVLQNTPILITNSFYQTCICTKDNVQHANAAYYVQRYNNLLTEHNVYNASDVTLLAPLMPNKVGQLKKDVHNMGVLLIVPLHIEVIRPIFS